MGEWDGDEEADEEAAAEAITRKMGVKRMAEILTQSIGLYAGEEQKDGRRAKPRSSGGLSMVQKVSKHMKACKQDETCSDADCLLFRAWLHADMADTT
ncbi:hypothetical protein PFISCL1PPCAC_22146, partial [Pristionchus fissidentatus]